MDHYLYDPYIFPNSPHGYTKKLEKTTIKYSSFTNDLRFSLRCHHKKILAKDLPLKSRNKTERSKVILQRAGKLLLQERIVINHVIRDRLKNSIE